MKKYLHIFLWFSLILPFFSCCDVDDTVDDSITIVSSDLLFDAAAATGSLTFEASGLVSVSTDAEWCMAIVNGSTVTVTVAENTSISGRSSSLYLSNSTRTVSVTIQQQGRRFYLGSGGRTIVVNDDAAIATYSITTNLDLSTMSFSESDSNWFTADLNLEGDLEVAFTENNTGHIREGLIYCSTTSFTDTISVYQYDFDNDIAGTVIFMYATSSGGTSTAVSGILSSNGLTFNYGEYTYTIPLTFVEDEMKFQLLMGQYCGMYESYYVYTVIHGGSYIGWGSIYYVDLPIVLSSSTNVTTMEFTDVGAFPYGYDCVYLFAFYSTSLSSSTMVGYVLAIYDGKIIRYSQ